jgi:drug/metabolite transporter (DMT)-like permease
MPLFPLLLALISAVLHVAWNIFARSQPNAIFFLRLNLISSVLGLVPALILEYQGAAIIPLVWPYLIVAGIGQALYYLGLTNGYLNGTFTVVYPLSRAIPVLIIALLDVTRNQSPSPLGWAGLILIVIGCILAPLTSVRNISINMYWNKTTIWIGVAALGTITYTAADTAAARLIQTGLESATRYHTISLFFGLIAYWFTLYICNTSVQLRATGKEWGSAVVATLAMFVSYTLVLWAYQLSPQSSYIVGVRQVSIVLGVVAAIVIFREPAARIRLLAATIITAGAICISLA